MAYKLHYFSGTQRFRYFEIEESAKKSSRLLGNNTILFVLEGELDILCNEYPKQVVTSNEMIFLPKKSIVHTLIKKNTRLLLFMFDTIACPESKLLLQSCAETYTQKEFRFEALAMTQPLTFFSQTMIQALSMGFISNFYYEIKHLELFHFMMKSYRKEELALFFFPLISKDIDFKNLVLNAYKHGAGLDDLIRLCCMSESVFRKHFKAHFGVSAYQWILQQRCKKICYLATFPNATIKGIMDELNFDSPSHFNRFCRRHFHCTPKDLIERHQNKIE